MREDARTAGTGCPPRARAPEGRRCIFNQKEAWKLNQTLPGCLMDSEIHSGEAAGTIQEHELPNRADEVIMNAFTISRALLRICAYEPCDSVPVNPMPVSEILLLSQMHAGPKFPLTYAPRVTRRENVDYAAKFSFYHG